MWIDSHCHLNHDKYQGRTPQDIIQAANAAKVNGLLTISCHISEEYDELKQITEQNDNVWMSVGTHPHESHQPNDIALSVEDIILKTRHPKIIAIGETGLDYYYNNSPKEAQHNSFRKHIRACVESDLPIIIHSRDAEEDTVRLIQEEGQGKLTGVFHCFTGSQWLADQALKLGFYISLSGIVTFPKATELQDTAKTIPSDKLLVETDAPYLAPVPKRGKTNEPANVIHTGHFLADLRCENAEELAKTTSQNFFSLFPKAKHTWI